MIGRLLDKLTYANVVATIALIAGLSGGTLGAYAAFRVPPNSVGSRQLKAKAVTGGKIANATISGGKIAEESITGQNIKLSALGTVPMAANAANAANANTVDGHAVSCPSGTLLIRGVCFDSSPNAEVTGVTTAADDCAAKGGYLPGPLELYSIRGILNLGDGIGGHNQFTDTYYGNTAGSGYSTIVVNGAGQLSEEAISATEQYTCAYPLVR